jgi:hypothetical protein
MLLTSSTFAGPDDKPDPLAGPTVAAPAKRLTLVERDFDGKVRRLEVSPEEAAVRLLDLDSATKVKVNEAIAARSKLFDDFVRQNFDLLLKFASSQGNKADQGMLLRETFEKAAKIREHGRLQEHVLAVLPEDKKQIFAKLVDDYRAAVIGEEAKLPNEQGKPSGRTGAAIKTGLEQFGQDVKRAYERVIAEGQGKLETFLKQLDLSAEQDQKVRKLIVDFYTQYLGKEPPGAAKLQLVMKVAAELEPAQKQKLWSFIRKGD